MEKGRTGVEGREGGNNALAFGGDAEAAYACEEVSNSWWICIEAISHLKDRSVVQT